MISKTVRTERPQSQTHVDELATIGRASARDLRCSWDTITVPSSSRVQATLVTELGDKIGRNASTVVGRWWWGCSRSGRRGRRWWWCCRLTILDILLLLQKCCADSRASNTWAVKVLEGDQSGADTSKLVFLRVASGEAESNAWVLYCATSSGVGVKLLRVASKDTLNVVLKRYVTYANELVPVRRARTRDFRFPGDTITIASAGRVETTLMSELRHQVRVDSTSNRDCGDRCEQSRCCD